MPFHLNIRHNTDPSADGFAPGDVRVFADGVVRFGSGPECEWQAAAEDFAPVHFSISSRDEGKDVRVRGEAGYEVFLNREPLAPGETALLSGDEIRVGHWTFRFQRLYGRPGRARRTDLFSAGAKFLVLMILVAEAGVVFWLPRQMRAAALWPEELSRQRAKHLLDGLRTACRPAETAESLSNGARAVINQDLLRIARHVREHEDAMTSADWRQVLVDLRGYQRILDRFERGTALRAMPEVDVDLAVQHVLRHGSGK